MSLYDVIITRRTIRQFKPLPIPDETLTDLVNAARLAPSAANRQPLEFIVVNEESTCQQIFPHLNWAAYIKPAGNPKPGQEPMAYVIVLANTEIREKNFEWDSGAAIENMLIAAWEQGIGSCWLISVDKEKIRSLLSIPEPYLVDSVLALGYPAENPITEDYVDSIKYWKDESGQLHVPKRKLEDVIHYNRFNKA